MAVLQRSAHFPRACRDGQLLRFRTRAEAMFARGCRSVMLAVAVESRRLHRHVIGSLRDVPLWPHRCGTPGELCDADSAIGDPFHGFSGLPSYDERAPMASHVPFAIARHNDVAMLDRPYAWAREDLLDIALPQPLDWLADPSARALYEEVCANAHSDEPRHVLADYLLEHDYDHGIVVAFGLSRTLDEDAYQRHESVLRECGPRWLGPLLRVIPAAGAHFRRGFLWRAEICAPDRSTRALVRGTPALGTVEQLRVLPPSPGFVLDPSLVALREVATLDADSVDPLLASPWAIERLGIDLDATAFERLATARTLPALRHFELASPQLPQIFGRLRNAAWFSQLATVELSVDSREAWFVRACALARTGPTVAVNTARRGWQLAFTASGDVRASMVGFDPDASLDELRRLIARLPDRPAVTLEPSAFFTPRPGDL